MTSPTVSSPLETVARNHGAAMATRHGRRVPAHFGSVGAEEAVCLRSVGMADRADRETFELRGAPTALESALVTVGEYAWCSFIAADRAWCAASRSTPRSAPRCCATSPRSPPPTAPPPTPRSA